MESSVILQIVLPCKHASCVIQNLSIMVFEKRVPHTKPCFVVLLQQPPLYEHRFGDVKSRLKESILNEN